ncbi:RluA family pseudouridine synthase [Magnetococcales bacterium HHB-1]
MTKVKRKQRTFKDHGSPSGGSKEEARFGSVQYLEVDSRAVDQRLDRFIADFCPDLPFSAIQRLLRQGQIRVNSKRVRGNRRLALGEQVRLPPLRSLIQSSVPQKLKIPNSVLRGLKQRILYRDDSFLVLNKPSRIPVHGGSGYRWGIIDAVRRLDKDVSADSDDALNKKSRPELCHRLDKEASGALLFGLSRPALREAATMLKEGRIEKHYLTLVQGHPKSSEGWIEQALTKENGGRGERMVVTRKKGEGQKARTFYRVERRFKNATLLSVQIFTGRTHQIRVHMHWLGHPLAGDQKYGNYQWNRALRKQGLKRLFLHARTLSFIHPYTKIREQIQAPLDDDLIQLLDQLT